VLRKNPFRDIYDNKKFKSVLLHREKPANFPFIVDLEPTNYCNLKCLFCGQQTMKRQKGFMSWETFRQVVGECKKYKTPIRFIRWGEPFLHPDIFEFIEYVKFCKLPLHITTNGLFLDKEGLENIVRLELDSIIFSFQGATKEEYELVRNNNRYDELRENIEGLVGIRDKKPKPYIHITSTMTNETEEEISAFKDYWGKIVDLVTTGKTNLSRVPTNILRSKETIGRYYRPCTEVYQKLSVNWNGEVTCCCADFDDFMIVGDLAVDTLHHIWNTSKRLETFRWMLDNNMHQSLTLCSTCWHPYDF